jgi:hypothetical protein
LLGLQGLLLAEGDFEGALAVLDSGLASGLTAAYSLYVFDVLAGAPFDEKAAEADSFARANAGELCEGSRNPETRWLFGAWHAHHGNTEKVARLAEALGIAATESGSSRDRLLADALYAHLALGRGDTTAAIARLRRLTPTVAHSELRWTQADPLPVERNLLAQLLLARGEYEEAHRVAAVFDHQEPVMFLPFLRTSLLIRLSAVEAMGEDHLANAYRHRLQELGWSDQPGAPE